jgi:hypothetical protein
VTLMISGFSVHGMGALGGFDSLDDGVGCDRFLKFFFFLDL